MKGAREFVQYLMGNPEQCKVFVSLTPEERRARAKDLGFEFTAEELLEEMELEYGLELSEEDLDQVSGGCSGGFGERYAY